VQNLLVLRFSMESSSRCGIAITSTHVQITAAETLVCGAARRILRDGWRAARHDSEPRVAIDLLVAVEPPARFDATAVRMKN